MIFFVPDVFSMADIIENSSVCYFFTPYYIYKVRTLSFARFGMK